MIDWKTVAGDIWASFVRTAVPVIVGAVVGWAAKLGFHLTGDLQDALATVVGGAFSFAYYLAVRFAEQHYPGASKFLLSRKAPIGYAPSAAIIEPGAPISE